jgi:hypothetical protein
MVKKLLLSGLAALIMGFGSCDSGKEDSGYECIANEECATTEQCVEGYCEEKQEPDCYSHNDCKEDRLCLEGTCEAPGQVCLYDPEAQCDSTTLFDGVYKVTKSNCSLNFNIAGDDMNGPIAYFGFMDDDQDCEYVTVAVLRKLNSTPLCIKNGEGTYVSGNYLSYNNTKLTEGLVEFTKCGADLIIFNWDNNSCYAILDKVPNGNITADCYK